MESSQLRKLQKLWGQKYSSKTPASPKEHFVYFKVGILVVFSNFFHDIRSLNIDNQYAPLKNVNHLVDDVLL